jgi:hemerythrin
VAVEYPVREWVETSLKSASSSIPLRDSPRSTMAIIEWSDELSVHVRQIDREHQQLVELINNLHEAMKARAGKETVGIAIDCLVKYTEFHFGAEEVLMTKHGYLNATTHRAEHRAFVSKTQEFAKGYATGKILLSMDVMDFLKVWLTEHICKVDKELGKFLNSKRVE